jgi:hypothetical protein
MRLRRAVLQISPKSSVPPRLLVYKSRPLLTHPESTLLQVLIPLHFNSPRINTYVKPGGGYPSFNPKVLQLVTMYASPISSFPVTLLPRAKARGTSRSPLSPVFATLTVHSQLVENTITLSLAFATLTDRVKHKSFACHSYKKHPGVGYIIAAKVFSFEIPPLPCSPEGRRPPDHLSLFLSQAFQCRFFTTHCSPRTTHCVPENFYPPASDLRHNPAAQGQHAQSSSQTGRIQ